MDQSPTTVSVRYNGLAFALAVAIGILGANAFADAAGFSANSSARDSPEAVLPRILCGIVLFVLSWMLLRFLFQLGNRIVWRLAQVRERPGLPVTLALLASGTLCVLCALLVIWQGDAGSFNVSPSMNLSSGNMPGGNIALPPNMPRVEMFPHVDLSMHTIGLPIRSLAVVAALVIGAALLAIGVWASLPPAKSDGLSTAPQTAP
jgi:hypothetical protein